MPHVVLSDGLSMAYREQGRGPVLLLVHGWAASGGFFGPQLSGLSDRHRVISIDLRGHGHSTGGRDRPLTTAGLAADLADFIARLDLADVVAVGWSMGAMVLWELCLSTEGRRIAGLVVEDMSPRILNDGDWSLGLRGGYDRTACEASLASMRADWAGYCRMLARSMLAPGRSRDRLSAFVEAELADQPAEPLAQLWAALAEEDYRDRLAGVTAPGLILHGRHGLYDEGAARFLERALPQARAVEFAHSGHTPHLEEPELFNRTVADFAAHVLRQPTAAVGVQF